MFVIAVVAIIENTPVPRGFSGEQGYAEPPPKRGLNSVSISNFCVLCVLVEVLLNGGVDWTSFNRLRNNIDPRRG